MASRRNMETQAGEARRAEVNPKDAPEKPQKTPRATRAKTYTLTFNVSLPQETAAKLPASKRQTVYLTGALHDFNPKLPDWDPRGVAMKQTAPGRYSVTIKGAPDSLPNGQILYKYTLGSWEQVELDAHCEEILNRHARLNTELASEQVIEDTVQNWRGLGR